METERYSGGILVELFNITHGWLTLDVSRATHS